MTNLHNGQTPNSPLPKGQHLGLALALFLLAPLTAEYLIGYLDSTGDLPELLLGLLFLAPLYGGPALIIREVTRRSGRGWLTILLLAAAFGLVQAGLVDHSLFNHSYMEIEWWDDSFLPTYIPALGISLNHALNFIPGHIIWSIGIPIALIESLAPKHSRTPWLGYPALAVVTILYILASMLIFRDMMQSEQFLPSPAQFIGTTIIVMLLVIAAFTLGKTPRPRIDAPVPAPWIVGAITFAMLNLLTVIEVILGVLGASTTFVNGWGGTLLYLLVLILLATLV